MKRNAALFAATCERLLLEGYSVRFRAEGTSMLPTIRGGDAIVVERAGDHRIRQGDIVLYRDGARLLAHRIVEIRHGPDGLTVLVPRGDSKRSADAPIGLDQVIGKVVAIERSGSRACRPLAVLRGLAARLAAAARPRTAANDPLG